MPNKLNDFALLIFRIAISAFMVIGHGYGKFTKLLSGAEVKFFDPFGLGAYFSFVLAALSEFIASILIILGILTRISSLSLIVTMFVAGFLYHADDPFGTKEKALLYFFSYLLIFLKGPGKFAVQRFYDKKLQEAKGFWRFLLK